MVNALARAMASKGHQNLVVGCSDVPREVPDGVRFLGVSEQWWGIRGVISLGLRRKIRRVYAEFRPDIVHIHGVWRPLQIVAAKVASELGIPFVLTAHGMYQPWLWCSKGWKGWAKKKVFFHMMARPAFSRARFIHSITDSEAKNLSRLFPGAEIVKIPNATDVPSGNVTVERPQRYVLFLGRIHPVKGLDMLVRAFAAIRDGGWKLRIAGPVEDRGYFQTTQEVVGKLGLSEKVEFFGPVFGEEKWKLLKQAWVVAVPSYSEVVGIVNLEAGAVGAPTITTFETGLWGWEEGGGILVHPSDDDLARGLKEALSWTLEERLKRGEQIRAFVEQRYSWKAVGKQWEELYHKMAEKGAS